MDRSLDDLFNALVESLSDLRKRVDDLERLETFSSLPWTNYSGVSVITGWGSYDGGYPKIYYRTIEDLVYLWFRIEGVSDSTSTSFTLPYAVNSNIALIDVCRIMNNGTFATGIYSAAAGSATLNLYATVGGGAWTASGNKRIVGRLIYKH